MANKYIKLIRDMENLTRTGWFVSQVKKDISPYPISPLLVAPIRVEKHCRGRYLEARFMPWDFLVIKAPTVIRASFHFSPSILYYMGFPREQKDFLEVCEADVSHRDIQFLGARREGKKKPVGYVLLAQAEKQLPEYTRGMFLGEVKNFKGKWVEFIFDSGSGVYTPKGFVQREFHKPSRN